VAAWATDEICGTACLMKKWDWGVLALCLAGAVLCGIASVRFAMDYRADRGATDFSSSHRPAK
jgi:hypothetical protein